MKNTKMPAIRFKGFNDDWEQRKLGDVIEKLTGGASIAPDDYVDIGYRTIPKGAVNSSGVADMSGCKNVSENFFKKNISSKTSSGELVTSLRDLVPTAPNMGRIVRICGETEDFLMPQGVYSIIVKEKISEDFLITYSNSPEYRKIIMAEKNGSTQVHIRNGEFLNIDIPLPSYEEQMKIGEHFKTLDHLITLHQRKLEKIELLKKSMLEKMFTRDTENIPKIRFDRYTDDWEQRKFSDIAARESSISTSATDIPSVEYEDVVAEEGRLNKDIHLKEAVKSGITFDGSQVLYGKLRPYLHNWLNPDFKGIAVGDWWVLKPINMDKKFLYCLIQTQQFDNIANQSSGSKMPRADWNLISNSEFMVPFSKEEQSKIGRYFDSLDHLITLHQRKLEKLKKVKKSLLEHMFPMEK